MRMVNIIIAAALFIFIVATLVYLKRMERRRGD